MSTRSAIAKEADGLCPCQKLPSVRVASQMLPSVAGIVVGLQSTVLLKINNYYQMTHNMVYFYRRLILPAMFID